MIKINRIFNIILSWAMLLGSIIVIVFRKDMHMGLNFFSGFMISRFTIYLFDRYKIKENYNFLITLVIWFNLFGLYYGYNAFYYYDKIGHFLIAFSLTFITYDYSKKHSKNAKISYLLIFLSVIGIAAMWEIYEYGEDVAFDARAQGVFDEKGVMLLDPGNDTMQDIIMGTLGALFSILYIRKKQAVKK